MCSTTYSILNLMVDIFIDQDRTKAATNRMASARFGREWSFQCSCCTFDSTLILRLQGQGSDNGVIYWDPSSACNVYGNNTADCCFRHDQRFRMYWSVPSRLSHVHQHTLSPYIAISLERNRPSSLGMKCTADPDMTAKLLYVSSVSGRYCCG